MTTYDTVDFTQYLIDQGYPVEDYFIDPGNPSIPSTRVQRFITNATRDIAKWIPMTKIGTFNTVVGQTDYDVFNRFHLDPAPAELVDAAGIRAKEVLWFPTTELGSLIDVFGVTPLIQNLASGQVIGIPDFSFLTPSDFSIFYGDYLKWKDRFGGNFRVNIPENNSPISLYPTPTAIISVTLTYQAPRPTTDSNWPDAAFRYMVEYHACTNLARQKSEEDAVMVNQFKAPSAAKFYLGEAERLKQLAIEELYNSGLFFEYVGERS